MKTLIDLGACCGDFTDSWLEKYPNTQVLCIEPDPDNVEILYKKFQMDPRVEILPLATSCEPGEALFYKGTSGKNGSLSVESEAIHRRLSTGKDVENIQVPTKTIPQLFHENQLDPTTTILKIDVEGLEHRLLCQMLDENIIPHEIYMEDGCRKTTAVDEWLARLEFYKKAEDLEILDRLAFEINVSIDDEVGKLKLKMPRPCENKSESRVVGYVDVNEWYAYRNIQDPAGALEDFIHEGVCVLTNIFREIEGEIGCNLLEAIADSGTLCYAAWVFDGPFKLSVGSNLSPRIYDLREHLKLADFNTGRSDLVTELPLGLILSFKRNHFTAAVEPIAIPVLTLDMAENIGGIRNSKIWYEAVAYYFQNPTMHDHVHDLFGVTPLWKTAVEKLFRHGVSPSPEVVEAVDRM